MLKEAYESRHRSRRAERRCDLLVRTGRHRFVGRSSDGRSTCLGFLSGSCCPHYDGEVERRPAYHALVQSGDAQAPVMRSRMPSPRTSQDGRLVRVVSKKAGAKAYYVSAAEGVVREDPLDVTRTRRRVKIARVNVTRYDSADAFLEAAQPLLMMAEAENNLLLGVAQGIARNPTAAKNPLSRHGREVMPASWRAPCTSRRSSSSSRARNREPIAALAHATSSKPRLDLEGVTGPSRSADDFALAWSKLSTCRADARHAPAHPRNAQGRRFRSSRRARTAFDAATCRPRRCWRAWTAVFVSEARIPEPRRCRCGSSRTPSRADVCMCGKTANRCRWRHGPGRRRAAYASTSSTRRARLRGKGYGTACVKALTKQQLEQGNAFCWLYTDLSSAASPNIFKRIGYWPVSDVSDGLPEIAGSWQLVSR